MSSICWNVQEYCMLVKKASTWHVLWDRNFGQFLTTFLWNISCSWAHTQIEALSQDNIRHCRNPIALTWVNKNWILHIFNFIECFPDVVMVHNFFFEMLIPVMKVPFMSWHTELTHYDDVIMDAIASLITSLTIVYSTVSSDADQRKHQSSASLAFVWGIHRWLMNSPHKWPVTRKMFPFDDVIMPLKLGDRICVTPSTLVQIRVCHPLGDQIII